MLNIAKISENAIVCSLPSPSCLENQQRLWHFAEQLKEQEIGCEVVVGMNNLTIFLHDYADLEEWAPQFAHFWEKTTACKATQGKLVEIPVCYGGEWGEDLAEVARFHRCTPQEIIQRHSAPVYTVFMIGFQAGFPYLGGLPESLHTPRRASPRTLVPAGSVGIGGSQTGVYPFASPGGWQLIGHTRLALFDKHASPPTLLRAGDQVKFVVEQVAL